jgi:hypothetical protein
MPLQAPQRFQCVASARLRQLWFAAEQYAIQTGQHPDKTTKENIARYREQLDKIGFSFDWGREVRTSSPEYYRWTQWIFIQLFNSWYNKTSNKAESICTLIEAFQNEGNANVDAISDDNIEAFSAEDWNGFSTEKQQQILPISLNVSRRNRSQLVSGFGNRFGKRRNRQRRF